MKATIRLPETDSKLIDPRFNSELQYSIRIFSPYGGELHQVPIIMDPFDDNTGCGLRMREGSDVRYTAKMNVQIQAAVYYENQREGTIQLNDPIKQGMPSATGRSFFLRRGETISLHELEIRPGQQMTIFAQHIARVGVIN